MIRRPPSSTPFPYPPSFRSRSLLALPILLALLRFRRRPLPIRPTSPGWALLRSLLLVTSYIAFYASSRLRRKAQPGEVDRKSTRLHSSHVRISYAVLCLQQT